MRFDGSLVQSLDSDRTGSGLGLGFSVTSHYSLMALRKTWKKKPLTSVRFWIDFIGVWVLTFRALLLTLKSFSFDWALRFYSLSGSWDSIGLSPPKILSYTCKHLNDFLTQTLSHFLVVVFVRAAHRWQLWADTVYFRFNVKAVRLGLTRCFVFSDVDECEESLALCSGGRCRNTEGSFLCDCPPGFTVDEDGTSCVGQ